MENKVKDLKQKIIKFDYDKNFNDKDYYVSNCNKGVFNLINLWPKWEKNLLNIVGESFSGKTHLINIFINKYKGIKYESDLLNHDHLKEIKPHQNIILENFRNNINENLMYSLINLIEQDNKYLIITSRVPLVEIDFKLNDLKSRSKNFLLQKINMPDDELMFAIILKNFSDRQISIDKKLINHIIKRIDRSYGKIFDFIYKIDEISLKRKKPVDYKIINEVLGE